MNQKEKAGQAILSLMGLSPEKFATTMRADFRIAPVNVLTIVGIFVIGLFVHLNVYGFSVKAVAICLGSAVVFTVFLRCFQVWELAIILGTIDGLITYLEMRPESNILLITIIVAALLAPSIQIAYQWEKAVLLRFGKFIGLRKSGLFLMAPVIDKVAEFVDQRIRVSDFSAETTLTSDGGVYVIESGDTIWDIASRFGTTVEAIVEANDMENPAELQVGQEIVIPAADEAASADEETEPAALAP